MAGRLRVLFLQIWVLCAGLRSALSLPADEVTRAETETRVAWEPALSQPRWTVNDQDGNICMLMAMEATLASYPDDISVPSTAVSSGSQCSSTSARFTLQWQTDFTSHTINVVFAVKGDNAYRLLEVNGTDEGGLKFSHWSATSDAFPSAALGHCMTCQYFEAGLLTFHQYQFQPFAQRSGSGYGPAEECSSGVSITWQEVLFLTVIVLLLLGCVGAVVKCCIRWRKRRMYTQVQ